MDASILLIGSKDFRLSVLEHIHALATFTIEAANSPLEGLPLIQAQQPDLLLIQSSQPDSLALCQQLKNQNRLAWIYCIVLDDGSLGSGHLSKAVGDSRYSFDRASATSSTLGPSALGSSNLGSSTLGSSTLGPSRVESPPLELAPDRADGLADLDRQIAALEAGADAYLLFPFDLTINATVDRAAVTSLRGRLLQAQVQTGLRQVQNHRDLIRTNDLLSAIALSDPLTELNNRRALEWELPRQIQNARQRDVPISLIMIDVDLFKRINDTYGHLVGDTVLKLFSARLRHNLRFYDTPYRYGGEEFVIILSNTDHREAYQIANRICQLIRKQPFSIDEQLDLTITISAGTATLMAEDDAKGTSLLKRADQRLLQAKTNGRDRVVGHPDGTE